MNRDRSIRAQTFTGMGQNYRMDTVIFAFSWREGHASGGICVRGEARRGLLVLPWRFV